MFNGALKAQSDYEKITGGCWLWHGPESFMQTIVALKLAETGHAIYIDASIQRLVADVERGSGRPTKNSRQRPDISVWYKDDETLRAVIELKRAWCYSPIERDAKKIEKYFRKKYFARTTGYILAYSDMKSKNSTKLREKFKKWKNNLGPNWSLIQIHVDPPKDDQDGTWGMVLLRYDPVQPSNQLRPTPITSLIAVGP